MYICLHLLLQAPPGLPWSVGESHGPYTKSLSTYGTVNAPKGNAKPPQPGNSGRGTPAVTVQQRHPVGPSVLGYCKGSTRGPVVPSHPPVTTIWA